jgi:hypothetical protein
MSGSRSRRTSKTALPDRRAVTASFRFDTCATLRNRDLPKLAGPPRPPQRSVSPSRRPAALANKLSCADRDASLAQIMYSSDLRELSVFVHRRGKRRLTDFAALWYLVSSDFKQRVKLPKRRSSILPARLSPGSVMFLELRKSLNRTGLVGGINRERPVWWPLFFV